MYHAARPGGARALICAVLLTACAGVECVAGARRVNISESSMNSVSPVVAASGATVLVAWLERTETVDGPTASIMIRRSTDGGTAFEPSRVVESLGYYPGTLSIAVDGSDVHLSWAQTQFGSGLLLSVQYTVSRDSGVTFDPPRSVSASTAAGVPDIRVAGDRVAIVWNRLRVIWAVVSTNGGVSFGEPFPVSGSHEVVDGTVRLALAGSTLSLAWIATNPTGRSVCYQRIDLDSPESVELARVLSTPQPVSFELALGAGGRLVFLTFVVAGRLYSQRSDDGGESFDEALSIGQVPELSFPRVVVDEREAAHVLWVSANSVMRYSRLGGEPVVGKRFHVAGGRFPNLEAGNGVVCITWQKGAGDESALFAAASFAQGGRFGKAVRLSPRGSRGIGCRAAVGDQGAHVVWQEPLGATLDVFYRRLD